MEGGARTGLRFGPRLIFPDQDDGVSVCRLANYRDLTEHELDAALFGLSIECPFGCMSSCPLTPLRKKPLRERFQTIDAMSHPGKLRLMERLVTCYREHEVDNPAYQNT